MTGRTSQNRETDRKEKYTGVEFVVKESLRTGLVKYFTSREDWEGVKINTGRSGESVPNY